MVPQTHDQTVALNALETLCDQRPNHPTALSGLEWLEQARRCCRQTTRLPLLVDPEDPSQK